MKSALGFIALVVILGVGLSCGDSSGPGPAAPPCTTNCGGSPVSSVVVSPPSATLSVGTACVKTQQFSVLVSGNAGVAQSGTWSTDIGSIDQNGLYTGTSTGTATARFTSSADPGKSGTAGVTVTNTSCVTVSSVVVSPATATLSVGTACLRTQQFAAVVSGSAGVTQNGVWSVQGPATITSSGLLTATGAGTAVPKFVPDDDKAKSGTANVMIGSATCVVNTRDSTSLLLASADSLAGAPVGLVVSTRAFKGNALAEVVVTPMSSFMQAVVISLPLGTDSVEHQVSGETRYEKLGFGKRFASATFLKKTLSGVLKPNCWLIRVGDFSGQNVCITSTQIRAVAGVLDPQPFWDGVPVWSEGLYPAKVMLYAQSAAGPWQPASIDSIQNYVTGINASFGSTKLVYAGLTTDSLPQTGVITVIRWDVAGLNDAARTSIVAAEVTSGKIHLSNTTLTRFPHEVMHVFGFSHTCSLGPVSIMSTATPECTNKGSLWFTKEDIATFQMVFQMRAQERKLGAALGFRESSP